MKLNSTHSVKTQKACLTHSSVFLLYSYNGCVLTRAEGGKECLDV